jgi:hypothetical protein
MLIRVELTWDILLNPRFRLCDWNNLIKKLNRIIKLSFKKKLCKLFKPVTQVIRTKTLNLEKPWSLILIQLGIEWWNWKKINYTKIFFLK